MFFATRGKSDAETCFFAFSVLRVLRGAGSGIGFRENLWLDVTLGQS